MARKLSGLPAAPGVVAGPAYVVAHGAMSVARQHTDDLRREIERLDSAVEQADGELKDLTSRARQQVGKEEAAIFAAQRTMLHDPELQNRVRKTVQKEQLKVESAWQEGIEFYAAALRGTGDSTLAARAADVEDVGRRVLGLLAGKPAETHDLREAAIIVADDLSPADTLS